MTRYFAFLHKEKAREAGINLDTVNLLGPFAFLQLPVPREYKHSFSQPGGPEYKQLEKDPEYEKFIVNGN